MATDIPPSTYTPITQTDGTSQESQQAIDDSSTDIREKIGKLLYQNNGARQFTAFQDSMFGIDSIRNMMYMPELESHGYTFITRPRLNLSPQSIRMDRVLSLLDNTMADTIGYAVRALLDTKITSLLGVETSTSTFFDDRNPFMPILTNRLLSLNGWPDPTIDLETTTGGFFSESITYPKGSDNLSRNYDISATFSDIQGSVIFMLMTMWVRWIHLATRGHVTAYMQDIEARRMCFTSAIYRFVMDPSNRYITKWAKATGCFPRSVPSGAYFNYDVSSNNVDVSMNLSIPFTVSGKIEYMDPIILKEFNMLMDRKAGNIANFTNAYDYDRLAANFRCLPYIDLEGGNNELQWKYDESDPITKDLVSENLINSLQNSQTAGPPPR